MIYKKIDLRLEEQWTKFENGHLTAMELIHNVGNLYVKNNIPVRTDTGLDLDRYDGTLHHDPDNIQYNYGQYVMCVTINELIKLYIKYLAFYLQHKTT